MVKMAPPLFLVTLLWYEHRGCLCRYASNLLFNGMQRTLSNMRTPSYIGELTCTDVDPGNLPPYILAMRAVPTDMSDLWALEMDVEYSGGVALDIEARLEMRELDFYNGVVNSNSESSSVAEVTSDLIEDFKHLEEELRLSEAAVSSTEKEAGDHRGEY